MAEEPQVLRGISWRDVFPFVNIFRAFRIAIHPSKLILGLVAILLLYGGGRVLDALWSINSSAVPNEINVCYLRENKNITFSDCRKAERDKVVDAVAEYLVAKGEFADAAAARKRVAAEPRWAWGKAKFWIDNDLQRNVKEINEAYKKDRESNDVNVKDNASRKRDAALQDAYRNAYTGVTECKRIKGNGLFDTFLLYQVQELNGVWRGVLGGNWLGGFANSAVATDGVIISVVKFFTVAPGWALRHHWLYFILYGAWFLVIWSIFAGAIARIAAVHVADEGRKLSVRQGLSFAGSKFLSFISAPMIPVLIIFIIGLLVAVGGLIFFGIPGFSAGAGIAGGILFFLALAAGFVMTLVVMGGIGGFNLMYPTIAVEGSDSFDAISRSFSYVYARPWRMLWYTLVAIGYGALTYTFVRLFIFFMLLLTHYSTGAFVYRDANNAQQILEAMWPVPNWDRGLTYSIVNPPLNWMNSTTAFIIAVWVHLTVALLGAFAISFYVSANTIIYYLMRREVDATEMDDVYLEQPEEEFAEPTAPAPGGEAAPAATDTAAAAASTSEPAATPPPAESPSGQPPAGT